jgi:ferrous iron transport protein B
VKECHPKIPDIQEGPTVVLVGQPNVGKSVIFGRLTGTYANVSNYPGTTVEITSGSLSLGDRDYTVIDTPGVNSLHPHSEDERVTRNILLDRNPDAIIQVADTKNLSRALLLTSQLLEFGRPLILCLNMSDEADQVGISIRYEELAETLGIEVIRTVAPEGEGLAALKKAILEPREGKRQVSFGRSIEKRAEMVTALLDQHSSSSARALALMLLAGDPDLEEWVGCTYGDETLEGIRKIARELDLQFRQPTGLIILKARQLQVRSLVGKVVKTGGRKRSPISETLGRWSREPLTGIPIFLAVILALYYLVGNIGAGLFVDFLEGVVFGEYFNPAAEKVVGLIPWEFFQRMLVGEYGLITMGLTYAVAIVLPIVGTFFLAFGMLEDSGYLPRLAIMSNRLFRVIGLNGKAILPMVLGLGCDTMATMTARILETRKERLIVTILLALGVPCSAQLGAILGLTMHVSTAGFVTVALVVFSQLLLVGYVASRLLPGKPSDFIFEIPPLRLPRFSNIIVKTYLRVIWFLREAIPLFLIGTLCLFLAAESGILALLERLLAPITSGLLSLPREVTWVFILGFLRRDYAAAGLYDLVRVDPPVLTTNQVVVALVVITLFVPCIANFLVMIKEQGIRKALAIVGFILPFAFLVGGILNWTLKIFNITL